MAYRGSRSGVPYADWSWNPVTGCTPVSRACEHCWARRMLGRGLRGLGHDPTGPPVQVHPDRLEAPRHWRTPRVVTVSFMGDWLHEAIPLSFIYQMLSAMAAAPSRTQFLTLTKRPGRLHPILDPMSGMRAHLPIAEVRVLMDRLWLGVSVEDQATADERLPILDAVDWPNTWVSVEPMLGPVSLKWTGPARICGGTMTVAGWQGGTWVVCGCESGPKARSFDPAWARDLRDQCHDWGIPFYYKQAPNESDPRTVEELPELDGRQWTEMPWERGGSGEC